MAATDKPFRSQRTLDIVYAVSNILMLLSVVWMFWQDYFREYKPELRLFREVEVAMTQRLALEQIPSQEEVDAAAAALTKAKEDRKNKLADLAAANKEMTRLQPKRASAEASFQAAKANVDSINSFRNIALEQEDMESAKKYDEQLTELNKVLATAQAKRDLVVNEIKVQQIKIEEVDGAFNKAIGNLKKVNDRFDTQVRAAITKQWGWGDWIRTLPVINGFSDPLKIQQFTINDIPIDYNFKYVTRFDRCMSCHAGIDRPAYTRANLEKLKTKESNKADLDRALALYKTRVEALKGLPEADTVPNPAVLEIHAIDKDVLTPGRITEYAAHPRLDLFVGANSKHPAEKFGCSSCHYGQGSGTSFSDSAHSPNTSTVRADWTKERHWEFNHMWDFPMLPTRFAEASCLKCHHEVTDLISTDNRVEAPKLQKGFMLIREGGCFGCHEISGTKNGQRIGPDLRLEPNPPLDDLLPIERDRVESDPDNRPGQLLKVGPALSRVSEKTQLAWIEKWLRSPSAFRPDTKMPHYYGLSTNDENFLKEQAPNQARFPNTEIASIAYFITQTSKSYLKDAEKQRTEDRAAEEASAKGGKANARTPSQDQERLMELLIKGRLDPTDKKEFDAIKYRNKLRKEAPLVDLAPGYKGDKEKGRILFTERGCLACHSHHGTEAVQGKAGDKTYAPTIASDAAFGPNLSQVAGKLNSNRGEARKWLIQWIIKPQVHSPRSRMPVTHLTPQEAADVAAWLLAQPAEKYVGGAWNDIKIDPPSLDELQNLVRVYLVRMLSKADMDRFLDKKLEGLELELVNNDITQDERDLYKNVGDTNALKYYLGKKAVIRLGCYGCHDIPGFDTAKPIGVGLNDWGKKAPERLAFEDIGSFFEKHYYAVPSLINKETGKPYGIKEGRDGAKLEPYEEFYKESLLGHNPDRIGFLNQKLREPRSYDFNRILAWDDRSRMPRFNLARSRKKADEDETDFQNRLLKEEADAREAVSTFVLGLVAEQVPTKSVNHPSGDRLAEVKGRQVLDKFNCNGCHLIRPGVYDFNSNSKLIARLEEKAGSVDAILRKEGEHVFLNHINWVGRNPIGTDRLTAYGVHPTLDKDVNDESDIVLLRLSEALRFVGGDKSVRNIPSSILVSFPLADMARPGAIQSQADFNRVFAAVQPYGGAFADLMIGWLNARNKDKYPISVGDSPEARASLPPALIGQGERTQADWLYQFLRDPQPIRRMAILRMPKFNMSKEEAKMLADYFAAVTRQINPGVGLPYPYESLPQQGDFDSPYWKQKTAAYVAQLKATKGKGKDQTLFDERVAAYTPLWELIRTDGMAEAKVGIQRMEDAIKSKTKEKLAKEKALDDKEGKKEDRLKELEAVKQALEAAVAEKKRLETVVAQLDVSEQKKRWEETEAYATDAYRMLATRELCVKCHQVGNFLASEQNKQGPPLALAHQRLRPTFIERWVNNPQRFVPYSSLMPQYFSEKEMKYQQFYHGASLEQIQALRDVLLNYPRVSNLPVNRLHNPDLPVAKK